MCCCLLFVLFFLILKVDRPADADKLANLASIQKVWGSLIYTHDNMVAILLKNGVQN